MTGIVLQHARMAPTGEIADVRLEGATIVAVGEAVAQPGDALVDLAGHLLLPAAAEPHAHLDKAFLAERIPNPTGDLMGAIRAMESSRHLVDRADIEARAERAALMMAANGYAAVRTHVDATREEGTRSVEALVAVKKRLADVIDIEIVALAGFPVVGVPGADHRSILIDSLAAGADLVGGCPHLDDDPAAATAVYLSIASAAGRAVDLHTDETLDPAATGLAELARQVLAGFDQRVTASHCVSLGQQSLAQQQATAESVASAGIGVVTLPATNLFLQGRGVVPMPRGLTAVAVLRGAGVTVAAGADNLQDPFNPVGRACPFETAALTILTAHLLPDHAWGAVSTEAHRVLGRPVPELRVGALADLIAVRVDSVRAAIAEAPTTRRRWRRGLELATALPS
jgi:cytosine/creatinine deaminase